MPKPRAASKGQGEPAAARRLESRALDHRDAAIARADLVPGFCFSAEDDLLFALGYPHLCLLYEDDQDPVATAERLLLEAYPFRQVAFPRSAAARLARGIPGGTNFDFQSDGTARLNEKAKKAAACADPLTLEDVAAGVRSLVTIVDVSTDIVLYLYEAFFGTSDVLDIVTDVLTTTPTDVFFKRPPNAARWLDAIAIMLRRLPEARAAELRPRLLAWASGAPGNPVESGLAALRGEPLVAPPRPVVWAPRDLVSTARARASKQPWYTLPDPRLVFLGGEDVYRIEVELWPKYGAPYSPGEAQRLILERFGRIDSPRTVELVASMLAKSRAKPAALAWLQAHGSYAAPHLGELARSGGPLAAAASAALSKLPS